MNKYNINSHHRRSIRIKGYDYSQAGLYFITICCDGRVCLFGQIKNGEMVLNDAGVIANECWLQIQNHFPNAILHEYIIMPNHIHGIIELTNSVGAENIPPVNSPIPFVNGHILTHNVNAAKNNSHLRSTSKTIGSIVRGGKIGVTKWMRQNTDVQDVWQRNYYEHIICNQQSYFNISDYIVNNPTKWAEGKCYQKSNSPKNN